MIGDHPSLVKPAKPKEAIVRIVLKGTVANLEIKKPSGKWEKVSGAPYAEIMADPQTGIPRGLGLVSITGLTMLMQENKNRPHAGDELAGGFSFAVMTKEEWG